MPISALREMTDEELQRERSEAMLEATFFWSLAARRQDGGRYNRRGEVAADRALRLDTEIERRAGGGRG